MKASINSSFISFELTTEEEIEAFKYSDAQIAGIQNYIAAAAEELVQALVTNDRNSLEEQVRLAYTKGQIDILKTLLARSDAIADELAYKQAQEELNSQNQFPANN